MGQVTVDLTIDRLRVHLCAPPRVAATSCLSMWPCSERRRSGKAPLSRWSCVFSASLPGNDERMELRQP
jgi:hypothetical protein